MIKTLMILPFLFEKRLVETGRTADEDEDDDDQRAKNKRNLDQKILTEIIIKLLTGKFKT